MKRIKPGDIFEVILENGEKRFIQFIYRDLNNLGADLVRCLYHFDIHAVKSKDILDKMISQNFLYYYYTSARAGIKLNIFKLILNHRIETNFETPTFRLCGDVGPNVKKSYNWYIKKGSSTKKIGELTGEYKNLLICEIISPQSLLDLLENGFGDIHAYQVE